MEFILSNHLFRRICWFELAENLERFHEHNVNQSTGGVDFIDYYLFQTQKYVISHGTLNILYISIGIMWCFKTLVLMSNWGHYKRNLTNRINNNTLQK